MINRKKVLLCFITVNFLISCSSLQSKERLKPHSVPKEAVWFEKRNLWALEEENGVTTFWYSNGKKSLYFRMINDKYEGLFIKWYENGNKRMEGSYKNDLFEGFWRSWWPNGQLKTEGNYINDKFDGLWKAYDENGKLIQEAIYKNGVLISEKDFSKEKKE